MALSMGEERILAEIEHHLVQEDPALAQRLEAFGQSPWRRAIGQAERDRLRRWGITGLAVLLAVVFITMVVAVGREPAKMNVQQHPYRPPAGPEVVVPPASEITGPGKGHDQQG